MKKLILALISATFLFACSGKEEPTAESKPKQTETTIEQAQQAQNLPYCIINNHDCWEILQLLKETEPVYSTVSESEMYSPDIESFKNPALKAKGFTVGYYSSHKDGGPSMGSLFWGESDWVNIVMQYDNDTPSILHLSFSSGIQQQYDLLKKHIK